MSNSQGNKCPRQMLVIIPLSVHPSQYQINHSIHPTNLKKQRSLHQNNTINGFTSARAGCGHLREKETQKTNITDVKIKEIHRQYHQTPERRLSTHKKSPRERGCSRAMPQTPRERIKRTARRIRTDGKTFGTLPRFGIGSEAGCR